MEIAYGGEMVNGVKVADLSSYLEVLIENYQAKGKGRPSELVGISQSFDRIRAMDRGTVTDEDNKIRQRLGNIIKLLGTTSIDNKDLKKLESISKKDSSNINKEVKKRYEQEVLKLEGDIRKFKNKFPELNNSFFTLDKNNLKQERASEMVPEGKRRFFDGSYCAIYEGQTRTVRPWISNVQDYLSSLKLEMSRIQGNSLIENDIGGISRNDERLKVVEDYGTMVREGKIESVDDKKVGFFAKLKFSPMKKSGSVKDIVNKLSDIDYAMDLINMAISDVSKSANYKETLRFLTEMKQKYSTIKLQAEEELKNTNYYDMEKKVSEQRKIDAEKLDEQYLRSELRAKFLKLLSVNDKEKEKELLKEIRSISLPENVKNEEKKNAAEQYQAELLEKETEKKIVNEEKDALHDVRAREANGLRQRAIEELQMDGRFDSQFVESGMDVRDAVSNVDKEKMISEKMKEIQSRSSLSVEEQALLDLKRDGYVDKNATLKNLQPYERDALYAQIRINKNAEFEAKKGVRR